MSEFIKDLALGGVGSLIGAAGSLFSGNSAQKFAKQSYKKRYQWQVQDLRKAGLNPMLAVSQGAPNVAQPSIPDIGRSASEGFSKTVGTRMLMEQSYLMRAQANQAFAAGRKSDAEAIAQENENLSGSSAAGKKAIFEASLERVKAETERLVAEAKERGVKTATDQALQPLVVEFQRLRNNAESYGLSEKEAEARFWDAVGSLGTVGKYLMPLLRTVIGKL